jgi:hypothetical protein
VENYHPKALIPGDGLVEGQFCADPLVRGYCSAPVDKGNVDSFLQAKQGVTGGQK